VIAVVSWCLRNDCLDKREDRDVKLVDATTCVRKRLNSEEVKFEIVVE
jgi:hypothetical protein